MARRTCVFGALVVMVGPAWAQDAGSESGLGGPPRISDYARELVRPGPSEAQQPQPQPGGWTPTVRPSSVPAGQPRAPQTQPTTQGRAVGLRGILNEEQGGPGADLTPRGVGKPGTFDKLWDAYPHGSADEVKAKIGGGVGMDWVTNTCAIRVSHALNAMGDAIQKTHRHADGAPLKTTYGADGSRYVYQVSEMRKYLTEKYGEPTVVHHNPGDGGAVPASFNGKQGVILFDVRVWSDATGHVDLWDGQAAAHQAYFDKARSVYLWEIR